MADLSLFPLRFKTRKLAHDREDRPCSDLTVYPPIRRVTCKRIPMQQLRGDGSVALSGGVNAWERRSCHHHPRALFMTDTRVFRGFRFPAEAILRAARWYLQFPISYRDLEGRLADRGSRSTTRPCTAGSSASSLAREAGLPPVTCVAVTLPPIQHAPRADEQCCVQGLLRAEVAPIYAVGQPQADRQRPSLEHHHDSGWTVDHWCRLPSPRASAAAFKKTSPRWWRRSRGPCAGCASAGLRPGLRRAPGGLLHTA